MSERRVIVTVKREKVPDLDKLLGELERSGFHAEKEVKELEEQDTILDLTQIVGGYDGDIRRLNSDGVTAEEEGRMGEMS